MATAQHVSEEESQGDLYDSSSASSDESDSDDNTDEELETQLTGGLPCKYYNSGGCQDGSRCRYLHVCKYALKGNCRYGSSCKLNHSRGGRVSSGARNRSASVEPKLTDGRHFQWQLKDGNNWMDIDNDHIIEAQYSLPHTKSIKIYNTPFGVVNIDFKRLKVYGKRLRVRRLDDGNTEWIWYCTLRRKWMKYGDKDSKGNLGPIKSADIEEKYQSNPTSSYTFNINTETFEIRFREMKQVGQKGKRKVTRRPLYKHQQTAAAGVSEATSAFQNLSAGTKPEWQFEGDSGAWYAFKKRRGTSTESSISSEDIERKYLQNPGGSLVFKVHGHSYMLDLGAMTQTNQKTRRSRRIRRVLL